MKERPLGEVGGGRRQDAKVQPGRRDGIEIVSIAEKSKYLLDGSRQPQLGGKATHFHDVFLWSPNTPQPSSSLDGRSGGLLRWQAIGQQLEFLIQDAEQAKARKHAGYAICQPDHAAGSAHPHPLIGM